MKKGVKLYVLAYTTMLDAAKVDSIKDILPTRQQIYNHVISQKGNENFQLYDLFVAEDKMHAICKEVRRKSSVPITEKMVLISLGDNCHPIISISVKKEEKIGENVVS